MYDGYSANSQGVFARQAAKAKARGYRNRETLKAMTYLIAGKLDLKLPT